MRLVGRKRVSSFEKRYDSFLSEASNEEVVSISKELMDVIATQIRSINLNALTLLGISMASLILSISLVSDLSSSITGSTKNIIFLLRMTSIAFMCVLLQQVCRLPEPDVHLADFAAENGKLPLGAVVQQGVLPVEDLIQGAAQFRNFVIAAVLEEPVQALIRYQ